MKNLKIKKLLTSLTAIGLTATATVSVVACATKKEDLGKVILDKLTEDTSVLYASGPVDKVIAKIKSIIINDSKLDANSWDLSGAAVTLKDKDGKEATGELKKENYSFIVKINGKDKNSSATPMQVSGTFTVTADAKKVDVALLNKFDASKVLTQLESVNVGDDLSDKVKTKVLEAVKKQFLGVESEVTVELKTTGEDAKAKNEIKSSHNFKFTLNADSKASKDFDVKFKYELGAEDTKVDLANANITLSITSDEVKAVASVNLEAVTNANLKSILDAKVLKAVQTLRSDAVAGDFKYEIYAIKDEAEKTSDGVILTNIKITEAAVDIFVKITAASEKLQNSKIVTVSVPKTNA